jgi:hypothetical protein
MEQEKQEGGSDEVTTNEAEEPEEAPANTVAKSLKCNEYVIMKHMQVGQEVMLPLFSAYILFCEGQSLSLHHRSCTSSSWEICSIYGDRKLKAGNTAACNSTVV